MNSAPGILKTIWKPLLIARRHRPYPVTFRYFLQNQPATQYYRLHNGLTVATEERECYNVCVGLFMDAGSRYESTFENGIAHFFEHIAFKRTRNRTKTTLEEQMGCIGAKFRSATNREMASYYVECLCQDTPLAVDLLTDCVYNNAFSASDIECQKRTVYCEMLKHDRDPNGLLDDYLHSTAFQGTPLAQTVMGPTCNLYNFTDATLCRFVTKFFDPCRTVLAAVGGVKHEQIVCLAEAYLSRLEPVKCVDSDVYRYTGSEVRYRDDSMPVANVVVAVEGPCFCAPDNLVMEVAAAIVGGWDRSQPGGTNHPTRLARNVSSSHVCDAYKAFNLNYKDTGLWGVQFIGQSLNLDDMVYMVQHEWMSLCNTVTEAEVERAKRELKAKWLSKLESAANACHDIGRWVLYNGERPSLLERICLVDNIGVQDVREVCTQYLYDQCPVVAAIGPTEGLSDYTRIRAGMYWLRL